MIKNFPTLKQSFTHEYTKVLVKDQSKTPTPGENPRKRKLSLKKNSQKFFSQHLKIFLPTLIGKTPKITSSANYLNFCANNLLYNLTHAIRICIFYHMTAWTVLFCN